MIKLRRKINNVSVYMYIENGVAHAEVDIHNLQSTKLKETDSGMIVNVKLSQINRKNNDATPTELHLRLTEELTNEQLTKIRKGKKTSIILAGECRMPEYDNLKVYSFVYIPSEMIEELV